MGAYGTSQGGGAWRGGLAGGLGGGGYPIYVLLPLGALVCYGAITGWLGHGYLHMRDCESTLLPFSGWLSNSEFKYHACAHQLVYERAM